MNKTMKSGDRTIIDYKKECNEYEIKDFGFDM